MSPEISNQIIFFLLLAWDLFWKGIGLWRASKNNQNYWFVAMLLVNTLGILPIIYLRFFQKKQPESKIFNLDSIKDQLPSWLFPPKK